MASLSGTLETSRKHIGLAYFFAARALTTYLIPGCVGRGVRLGSESFFGGGVWKSGNLKIWEFGDLGTWKSRNVEIWGPGNPENWSPTNGKIKSLKVQIRSAQNVGKVWISREKTSRPHLGPSQVILSMSQTNPQNAIFFAIFLGGPMGPIHPVWALAAIHPRWGNRYPLFAGVCNCLLYTSPSPRDKRQSRMPSSA